METTKKEKLILFRKDLISLIVDLERVISKQENLIRYGQITEEQAKININSFEKNIQDNLKMIKIIEEQLERDYKVILRY